MLLPFGCGRCYCHFIASLSVLMADGIAKMSLVFYNHQCWYIQYIQYTYFTYQGQHFEQLEGAAMGSPISPIVANLFMENFEEKALSTAPHPPYFWKRFVDDTFTILESSQKRAFLDSRKHFQNYFLLQPCLMNWWEDQRTWSLNTFWRRWHCVIFKVSYCIELFITHCTNTTSTMNPFTFIAGFLV